jgi:LAS superfamily LD-carboxypeptidase LdcB
MKSLPQWAQISLLVLLTSTCALASVLMYREISHRKEIDGFLADDALQYEKIATLEDEVIALTDDRDLLKGEYMAERTRNDAFEAKVSEVANSVGTLEKLRALDPELLKKYSRVYFLNEHYVPTSLSVIDSNFVFDEGKKLLIHTKVRASLERMLTDAKEDGAELTVLSSYRSFGEQAALKNGYVVKYGTGANAFSADQGYSEHQLGTTVDLGTPLNGRSWNTFDQTKGYAWLVDHAHEYGFTLSYPKDNTYYQYEPWHWRYVGKTLATYLYEEEKHLYDLSEREIDTYLITIFD